VQRIQEGLVLMLFSKEEKDKTNGFNLLTVWVFFFFAKTVKRILLNKLHYG